MTETEIIDKLIKIEGRLTRIETRMDDTMIRVSSKQLAGVIILVITAITGSGAI